MKNKRKKRQINKAKPALSVFERIQSQENEAASRDMLEASKPDAPVKAKSTSEAPPRTDEAPPRTDEAQAINEAPPKLQTAVATPPRSRRKKRRRRRLNYVRRLILLVSGALLIFSGYNLIKTFVEYKIGDDMYADIEHSYLSFPSAEPAATPKSSPTPTPTPTPEDLHDLPGVSMDIPETPQISFVEDYAPDVWPSVDFEGLRGVNADTEAWLLCVGTNINYPVVHSHDNVDYLTKMFDGRKSKLGSIFVDARNNWNFVDRNTIVYGHNMRNHSMLWTLTEYRFQSFYDEHPTLRLILPDGNYEIQVFAAVVTQAEEISFWDVWWETDEDYAAWLDMVKSNSKIRTKPEVTTEDRIVTLSTCTYEYSDARCLVYGKLVKVD